MTPSKIEEKYPLIGKIISNTNNELVASRLSDVLGIEFVDREGESPRFVFIVGEFKSEKWDELEVFIENYNKLDSEQKIRRIKIEMILFGLSSKVQAEIPAKP